MPSNPVRLSITGLSSSSGYPMWMPDRFISPFSISAQMIFPAGSSGQVANLEGTDDYQGNLSSCFSGWISSAANWTSLLTGVSSNQMLNISMPVSAIRLNVSAGSSTAAVACNLVQVG